MRRLFCIALLSMTLSSAASADEPKTAVLDFELIDSTLQGETDGQRADEHARLLRAGDQLRQGLAASGKYVLLDIAPVRALARNSNLQACGGCDVQFAQTLGADLAVTGTVQKVSNLILNMNIYVRNARTGHLVTSISATSSCARQAARSGPR